MYYPSNFRKDLGLLGNILYGKAHLFRNSTLAPIISGRINECLATKISKKNYKLGGKNQLVKFFPNIEHKVSSPDF